MSKIIITIFYFLMVTLTFAQNSLNNNLDKQYTPPLSLSSKKSGNLQRDQLTYKNSIGISPIFTISHQIAALYYTRIINRFSSISIGLGKSYGSDLTFKVALDLSDGSDYNNLTFNYGKFEKGKLFYELKFNLFTFPEKNNGAAFSLYTRNNKYQRITNSSEIPIRQTNILTDIHNIESGFMFSYIFFTKRISHCVYVHAGYMNSKYIEINWNTPYYTLSTYEKEHKFILIGVGYNIGFDF
ncbi:MAG TPA: hypothetical protein PKG63_02495 [Bacteroidales bacterium]|nr:hypothetical protein [Bacteroidales bacterium]HNV95318.1 hypothetical protein [Bacteroidales bacterium]